MFNPFEKLQQSLSKTKDTIFGRVAQVIGRRAIDDKLIDEIEEILIEADVGVGATMRLIQNLRDAAQEQKLSGPDQILAELKDGIREILNRQVKPTDDRTLSTPEVWLIVGVNGVGKTTTIGKLAKHFASRGKKVIIAACDTFRAAAIDQISIWAERSKVDIIKSEEGADPASVAFDAARAAGARKADLLLVDTAGRLHTKSNLMEELKKIKRVIVKALPQAQIYCKLIIDGSTGQNALSQVRIFQEAVGCDGLIVTKLDGTAKGGVLLAISEELDINVDFIGVGESVDDLQPFDPDQFAEALLS